MVQEEPIASAGVIFRGLGPETETLSEVVPEDSMDPARVATAIVASPAWDLVVAIVAVVVASAAVAEASVGAVDFGEAVVVEDAGAGVAGAGKSRIIGTRTAGAQI